MLRDSLDLIAQIPQVVYAATTGHTRTARTSVGSFSFHRIEPGLFFGFEWYGERRDFLIAVPEKALIDSLYLSGRKGRRFSFFPELDMNGFDFGLARKWIRKIGDPRIRKFTLERLELLR